MTNYVKKFNAFIKIEGKDITFYIWWPDDVKSWKDFKNKRRSDYQALTIPQADEYVNYYFETEPTGKEDYYASLKFKNDEEKNNARLEILDKLSYLNANERYNFNRDSYSKHVVSDVKINQDGEEFSLFDVISDEAPNPEEVYEQELEAKEQAKIEEQNNENKKKLLASLTEQQLRRYKMIFEQQLTYDKVAEIEGCTKSSIRDSINAIKKKAAKIVNESK